MPKGLDTAAGLGQAILGVGLVIIGVFFAPVALASRLIIAGGALIISGLTTVSPGTLDAQEEISSALITGRSSTPPRTIIYGNRRVGGNIVYMLVAGAQNERMSLVIALASHEVEAINEIYFDNELAIGLSGAVGKYIGYVGITKKFGSQASGSSDLLPPSDLISKSQPEFTTIGNNTGLRFKLGSFASTAFSSVINPTEMSFEVTCIFRGSAGTIAAYGNVSDKVYTNGWELRINELNKIEFENNGNVLTTTTAIDIHKAATITVIGNVSGTSITVSQTGNSPVSPAGSAYVKPADGSLFLGARGAAGNFLVGNIYQAILNNAVFTPLAQWDLESVLTDSVGSLNLSLTGGWTSNHIGTGIAYIWLELIWNESLYSSGIPNITINVSGKKVKDPSLSGSPDAFTSNAALIANDWFSGNPFGYNLDYATEVDEVDLLVAKAVSEEGVSLLGGGTEERYTINAVIKSTESKEAVAKKMMMSMGGSFTFIGGLIHLYAGEYTASVVTITSDDIVGNLQVQPYRTRDDSFNYVTGVFPDPDTDFEKNSYPPFSNSSFETEDGERVIEEINFPYITSVSTCQRLAKLYLLRNREEIVVRCSVPYNFFGLAVPETVALSVDWIGFPDNPPASGETLKEFKIVDLSLSLTAGSGLIFNLTLFEEAESIYTWASGDETAVELADNTELPVVTTVYPPENITLSSGTDILDIRLDGTIFSRIKVSWDSPSDIYVVQGGIIEIEYKLDISGSTWQAAASVSGDVTETFILDVKDGSDYFVRARSRNTAGFRSIFANADASGDFPHTVIGKTAAPENVTNFISTLTAGGLLLSWDAVSDIDLSYYEIQIGTVWDASGNETIEKIKGNTRVTQSISLGSNPFMIKAVDTTGNESVTEASLAYVYTVPDVASMGVGQNDNVVVIEWPDVSYLLLAGYTIKYNPQGTGDWDSGILLTNTDRTTSHASISIPPGDWTILVKAVSILGDESTTAITQNFTVVNNNVVLEIQTQEPTWAGTKSNFTEVHYTGRLPIDDQTSAAANDDVIFDTYCDNPFATSVYTTGIVTIASIIQGRTYFTADVRLHPDETSGSAAFFVEMNIDDGSVSGGAFAGWEPLITATTRTIKRIQWRITLQNTLGKSVLYGFSPVTDLPFINDGGTDVVISAGTGTVISYNIDFPIAPRVIVTAQMPTTSGALFVFGTYQNRTISEFEAHVIDTDGADVGGVIDWSAIYDG